MACIEEEANEVKSRLTGIRSEESCGEEKDDCFQKVQVELAAVEDEISAINNLSTGVVPSNSSTSRIAVPPRCECFSYFIVSQYEGATF